MRAIRSTETRPERMLRSALHRAGRRFRKNLRSLPGAPDIVFPSARVVVFVDGDFWHGYRLFEWQHKLSDPWRVKILGNIARDKRNRATLRRHGWKVIRVWEHEVKANLPRTVERVGRILDAARAAQATRQRRLPDADREHPAAGE